LGYGVGVPHHNGRVHIDLWKVGSFLSPLCRAVEARCRDLSLRYSTGEVLVKLRARIGSPRDFLAGLLFIAIGLATAIGASDYPLGTIRNIGPGYYPILLGIALVLLGGAIAFKSLKIGASRGASEDQSDDEGIALRPLIMVIVAVLAFGVLVRPFGLGVAIIALIGLSSLAGRDFNITRVVLLCIGMVALSWLVFVYLLGLSMTMWPR
jgi:hypothetical protein